MKVELYIGRQLPTDPLNGERLDLYGDEKITLNLKNTDINNLSKSYADFTQTFTVPASEKNNNIFKHWFNIDINNQFNANQKVSARLDIDSQMFRIGKVRLESVTLVKGGRPSFYSITFFTNLVSLKDKFGDDNLQSLRYVKNDDGSNGAEITIITDNNFDYLDDEVYGILRDNTAEEVIIPLGSTERLWSFDDGNAITDVKYGGPGSDVTKAIKIEELRPAVQMKLIMQSIEARYGMTLLGNFLDSSAFESLYMWCNKNEVENLNAPKMVDIYQPVVQNSFEPGYSGITTVTVDGYVRTQIAVTSPNPYRAYHEYIIQPSNPTVVYSAFIKDRDGNILAQKVNETGSESLTVWKAATTNGMPATGTQNFDTRLEIQTTETINMNINVYALYGRYSPLVPVGGGAPLETFNDSQITGNNQEISGEFDLLENLPEMKVVDWFESVVKMHNIVLLSDPFTDDVYTVTTLADYYAQGRALDLTDDVKSDKIIMDKVQTYKTMSFKYADNPFYLNILFKNTFGREYGSDAIYKVDGGESEYKVEVKFNLMYNVQVGAFPVFNAVDDKLAKKLNVPIIMARGEFIEADSGYELAFDENGASTPIDQAWQMDSHIFLSGGTLYDSSITFSQENDFRGVTRTQSLYQSYYKQFIDQIYSLRTRKLTYEIQIPTYKLYGLDLNEIITVGDYNFRIDEFSVDITTGEGTIKLINLINNGII